MQAWGATSPKFFRPDFFNFVLCVCGGVGVAQLSVLRIYPQICAQGLTPCGTQGII